MWISSQIILKIQVEGLVRGKKERSGFRYVEIEILERYPEREV